MDDLREAIEVEVFKVFGPKPGAHTDDAQAMFDNIIALIKARDSKRDAYILGEDELVIAKVSKIAELGNYIAAEDLKGFHQNELRAEQRRRAGDGQDTPM